jgi:hypothetical protein
MDKCVPHKVVRKNLDGILESIFEISEYEHISMIMLVRNLAEECNRRHIT